MALVDQDVGNMEELAMRTLNNISDTNILQQNSCPKRKIELSQGYWHCNFLIIAENGHTARTHYLIRFASNQF